MVRHIQRIKTRFFSGKLIFVIPWLLLLSSMLISVVAWWQQDQIIHNNARADFNREVNLTRSAILARLSDYAHILEAAQSFSATSADLNQTSWQAFIRELAVSSRYPGLTGLGFIAYVPRANLADFIQSQQLTNPDYTYHPPGDRAEYFLVQLIDPAPVLSSTLGYDLGLESTRRATLEIARDSGKPAITSKVALIQDAVAQPSIIMSVPVYRAGAPHATLEERRANIVGWVNASFRVAQLMDILFTDKSNLYTFSIYEGNATPENLLYQAPNQPPADYTPSLTEKLALQFGGRGWVIHFSSLPAFDRQSSGRAALLVLFGGLLASLLLFTVTNRLVRERTKSLALAQRNINQLQQANEFSNQLVNTMGQGLIVITDGQFEFVNPAFAQLLGYSPEEIIGRSSDDLVLPEDLAIVKEHRQYRINGRSTSYEIRLTHREGHLINVLVSGAPRYQNGSVTGLIAVITDLTERKQAEESIRRQNEYLAALHETTLALINQLDLTELLRTIIVRSGNLLGTPFGTVCLLEPDGKRMKRAVTVGIDPELLAEYLEPGQGFVGHIWNSGEPFFVADYRQWANRLGKINLDIFPVRSSVGIPLKSGDKVIGVLSLIYFNEITSIGESEMLLLGRFAQLASLALLNAQLYTAAQNELNERKRTELALEQARDEALEASRLKSEFVATMSHEIRTPLSAVLGMTELLLDSDLNPEQREYATIAINSAQNLLNLINDILDFSKIEANKLVIEEHDFELAYLLDNVTQVMAARLHEKQLTLTTKLESDVPRRLRGDGHRIRQILLNLVSNAVKFTERGKVTVRVRVQDWLSETKPLLHFEVEDTGIGLSEVARKRLFQPFTQADGSMTRKYGGTGLGLSISKKLVNLMGGEIGVESQEGQGSTFWFDLPLEVVIQKQNFSPVQSPADFRVLVVDGNLTYREVLTSYLESWSMQTQAVQNGSEALKLLREADEREQPFDLAIVDLTMPDMDGYALARAIQQDKTLAGTRLILLTAFDHKRQARQAGFIDYLTKPVRQSQLYDSIINIMDSETGVTTPRYIRKLKPEATPVAKSGKILVAEDNPINQEMALHQLRKLGFSATVVSNGAEVLEAISQQQFDLILMDCQMPDMDGFETTRRIRQMESAGGSHVPIVAMTANAMRGDREACLAAGMDDYLSKPVNLHQLERMLGYWLSNGGNGSKMLPRLRLPRPTVIEPASSKPVQESRLLQPTPTSPLENTVAELPVLDSKILRGIRELQGEDEDDLLDELIKIYFREAPLQLANLRQAQINADAALLRRVAHTLKSSSLNLGAKQFSEWCKELEQAGRDGTFEGVAEKIERLEKEFPMVQKALELVRQKGLV